MVVSRWREDLCSSYNGICKDKVNDILVLQLKVVGGQMASYGVIMTYQCYPIDGGMQGDCKKSIYLSKFGTIGSIYQNTVVAFTPLPPPVCGAQIVILKCSTHEADILHSRGEISTNLDIV
jgi:hypothetical protein